MPTLLTRMERDLGALEEQPLRMQALLGLGIAFWPLGPWYARRLMDGSDDPLGLIALVAALVLLWRHRGELAINTLGTVLACVVVLLVSVFHRELPPLMEGAFAMLAVIALFGLWRRMPGVAVLLVLSLPVMASVQFFFGYPLRVFTAVIAQALLFLSGHEVMRQGTELMWQGVPVGVDAPCSGVRMLWAGCFVAAGLAGVGRLRWRSTVLLLGAGIGLVLLANGVRAALLFPGEAGWIQLPHFMHEAIGLLVLAPALWLLVRCYDSLVHASGRPRAELPARVPSPRLVIALLGCGIATGALRIMAAEPAQVVATPALAWPMTMNGHELEPLMLTSKEKAFTQGFPGQIARFQCGPAELVLRRVLRATRMLHSSRDCFQAAGYDIEPCGQFTTASGERWASFIAERGPERLRVRERIFDDKEAQWTDPGSWFWSALFNPHQGPWLAVTMIERDSHIAWQSSPHR